MKIMEWLLLKHAMAAHIQTRRSRTIDQWEQHIVQGLAFSWGFVLFTYVKLEFVLYLGLILIVLWETETIVRWKHKAYIQRIDMFHDIVTKSLGLIIGLVTAWFWA